ncbi:hypothetical protein [Catenovulum sediminis]|uniref:hypothetical protein n=1 Tax=Catenovulum sediminis TaxID=1740262 RepID=UPI00117F84F1|nr:hypothetical protein [Catenovulum sediminis]
MGFLGKLLIACICVINVFAIKAADATDYFVFTKFPEPLTLTRQQVKQLYLGARLQVADIKLEPLVLPAGHRWRAVFNTRVVGLTESRINSYWAQMRFTGKRKPPLEVESIKQMFDLVESKSGILAVAPSDLVDKKLYQVVYQFTE